MISLRTLSRHQATGVHFVMGTFLKVSVESKTQESAIAARDRIFRIVQDLEEKLSIFRPASEISQVNQAAGRKATRVSGETYVVVAEALRFARLTGGAFDPTVQPLIPACANYQQVELNPKAATIFLRVPAMRLDLGGIGKGFALDRAIVEVKEDTAVRRLTMNFGGQLIFWSRGGEFPPETVAIENPAGGVFSTFTVTSNASVSTSSQMEQAGHLLNPQTCRPAEKIKSATVVAPTATEAEALSTALFVLGTAAAPAVLQVFSTVQAFLF